MPLRFGYLEVIAGFGYCTVIAGGGPAHGRSGSDCQYREKLIEKRSLRQSNE